MNYLAVDTATEVLLILLVHGGRKFTYASTRVPANHSASLFPEIQNLLQAAGLEKKDLDFLACAQGPGSFTGLRIGMAGMKGLSQALGIPLVGFSSLDAMGWESRALGEKALCAIDGRKNKFYLGLYHKGLRIGDLKDATLEETQEILETHHPLLSGYQGHLLAEKLLLPEERLRPLEDYWLAGMAHICEEAWEKKTFLSEDAGPLYLRLSEAEENHQLKK